MKILISISVEECKVLSVASLKRFMQAGAMCIEVLK